MAVGGPESLFINGLNDTFVVVQGNTVDSKVQVVAEQPLVATALDVIMALGESSLQASCLLRAAGCV